MVPVQDPARLVVAPDGGVSVVGEPRAAVRARPRPRPPAPGGPGAAPARGAVRAAGAEQPQPPVAPAEPGPAQLASGVAGAQQGTEGQQATDGPTVVAQGAGDQPTAPGASTAGTGNG